MPADDFRVLKILPSNLDVVEDIKQIGNEYYFKKDVEVVIDDRENEIVDSESGSKAGDKGQPQPGATNSTTAGDGDSGDMTETLDIVVLPAPTKDIEIYDNDLVPDGETGSSRPDDDGGDDISVIGLISPTRTVVTTTSSMTTASGGSEGSSRLSAAGSSSTPLPPTVETTLGHWDVDRLDLPEPAEEENRTSFAVDEGTPPPFSFNNRTFQTIQETVRKEFDESQGPYPPVGNYDEEDDFDDEDEVDEDEQQSRQGGARTSGPTGGRLDKSHKKHMSVQRTLLKHPLRQGFLMTPSYPKYYIGDSTCRWTLYAGVHQRIKLTVLDLALRYDEECRDYLQVVDINTNQTLFHSCTESSRPIEIVSIQERLEVSVRTTTKVIYPKRGVLVHYTALGCELPSPTPGHMRLVRRTEHRVKYVCDPLHVFPDTGESVRELICTAKHTWNRPLPACIEKRATEGSGLVSHYEQKRRYGDTDNMSDKQADTVYDILIPSLIIAGLFVVNGIVFAVIMRYRNKRKQ
uniref:CUB domain-containing protein n=1 Tax=Anopheles maculatus TaxID=74869 RepID=A0A182S5P6_9DIPT